MRHRGSGFRRRNRRNGIAPRCGQTGKSRVKAIEIITILFAVRCIAAAASQQGLDLVYHDRWVKGLCQNPVASNLGSLLWIDRLESACEQQHWNVGELWHLPDVGSDLVAALSRHSDFRQY